MLKRTVMAAALAFAMAGEAAAQDALKVAIGQRGNWNAMICELGQRAGIFAKHGLKLEALYTSGGGETQQAVISGSVDVGTAVGTLGALGAFSKGAPIRIIGAETTGAADYWYAAATSAIKSLKDTDGKTIAYSTNGSSTHSVVLAFMKELGLKARPVATGNPPTTLTQVMTGQVDVGWAAPPFGLKEIDEGKIRIVARANDSSLVKGQTIRLLITNAVAWEKRRDALVRFLDGYRESLDYMYSDDPRVMKDYGELVGVSPEMGKRVREFFAKDMLDPDEIKGLPSLQAEGVALKYMDAELTPDQLKTLIQIPPRKK